MSSPSEHGKIDERLLENDDSSSTPNTVSRIGAGWGALSAAEAASFSAVMGAGTSHALAVLLLWSTKA